MHVQHKSTYYRATVRTGNNDPEAVLPCHAKSRTTSGPLNIGHSLMSGTHWTASLDPRIEENNV